MQFPVERKTGESPEIDALGLKCCSNWNIGWEREIFQDNLCKKTFFLHQSVLEVFPDTVQTRIPMAFEWSWSRVPLFSAKGVLMWGVVEKSSWIFNEYNRWLIHQQKWVTISSTGNELSVELMRKIEIFVLAFGSIGHENFAKYSTKNSL